MVHIARWLPEGVRAGLCPLQVRPEARDLTNSHLVREEMSNTNTAEHLKQVLAGGFIELTFFRERNLARKNGFVRTPTILKHLWTTLL